MGDPRATRPFRRLGVLVAVVVLVGGLAACGDDTAGPSPAPGPDGAPVGLPEGVAVPQAAIDEFVRGMMADTGVSEAQARCMADFVFSDAYQRADTLEEQAELTQAALDRCGIDPALMEPPGADPSGDPSEPGPIESGIAPAEHVPSRPLPATFPLPPTARMWNDFPGGFGPDSHTYLFSSSLSAEEIVEFFGAALRDLGLDVTEEFVMFEEFGVTAEIDGQPAVAIGWLGDDDLGERGFMVVIDHGG